MSHILHKHNPRISKRDTLPTTDSMAQGVYEPKALCVSRSQIPYCTGRQNQTKGSKPIVQTPTNKNLVSKIKLNLLTNLYLGTFN